MNSATKLFNELHDSNLAIVFDITENLNPSIFFQLRGCGFDCDTHGSVSSWGFRPQEDNSSKLTVLIVERNQVLGVTRLNQGEFQSFYQDNLSLFESARYRIRA